MKMSDYRLHVECRAVDKVAVGSAAASSSKAPEAAELEAAALQGAFDFVNGPEWRQRHLLKHALDPFSFDHAG